MVAVVAVVLLEVEAVVLGRGGLLASAPPGGLVVDCFAGSGTTGAVARKLGRRAILIEKREAQCRAIVERLAQGDLLPPNVNSATPPAA